MSYDCSHVPLYCLKEQNQKKNKIKSRKIYKKIRVQSITIILWLCLQCSTWLKWTYRVLITVFVFREPYSVLWSSEEKFNKRDGYRRTKNGTGEGIVKEKFGEVDKKSSKVKELRFMKQEKRICEEHIQIFKRTARESEYEGRVLIKEYKRSFNRQDW